MTEGLGGGKKSEFLLIALVSGRAVFLGPCMYVCVCLCVFIQTGQPALFVPGVSAFQNAR